MSGGAALQQLAGEVCVPTDGLYHLLNESKIQQLSALLPDNWEVIDHRLAALYRFDDYDQSLAAVNRIAELAGQQNHHPRIVLEWGSVAIQVWTHVVDGLTRGDFVFAAKSALLLMAEDDQSSTLESD